MQENIIECKNLTHSYGKKTHLRKFEFQHSSRANPRFIGKNGTGKTTTINILSGYLQPHSGLQAEKNVRK